MYEVCLSSRECGILTLRCECREEVTDLLEHAFYYSLDFAVKEVKDAKPDT